MYEREDHTLFPDDKHASNDEMLRVVDREYLLPEEEITEEEIDKMLNQLDKNGGKK